MTKETRFPVPAAGAASLLAAFGILCFSMLAMLGLSTVRMEKRMADRVVEQVSAYYEADLQAQEIFARLRSGEQVTSVREENGRYTYQCHIAPNQYLAVTLENKDGNWSVLCWQAVAMPEAPSEQPLNVWTGTEEGKS